MFKKILATVKENNEVAKRIYRMTLKAPGADLKHFVPGQFADLSIPGHNELLLRRPMSICSTDAEKEEVTLIYQIKGKGTNALSGLRKGEQISTIMPVGRGFNLKGSDKNVFLVGGGVGIAPLLPVTRKWPDKHYEAFLGYRGKDYEYCLAEMSSACSKVFVTSDDGTIGEKGLVTEALGKRIKQLTPDVVITCGPPPMLRAVKTILEKTGIPAQVSMEQRMCCGFGACSTCVCGVGSPNGLKFKKVCVEGPVFDLYEVVL